MECIWKCEADEIFYDKKIERTSLECLPDLDPNPGIQTLDIRCIAERTDDN